MLFTSNCWKYVSVTSKIDIVLKQNSECFSEPELFKDGNSKYYQGNCESQKDKQINYYAENSDKIWKMKKA